ncbi:C2 domain protein [Trichuris suis]|nr:C2 domain protein [Trichuris suis]
MFILKANNFRSKSVPPEDIPFVVPRRPSRVSLLDGRSANERSLIESLNLELYVSGEGDEYFYGENHIGRIWFEIEFDAEREKLSVWVDKVRNLPCRSESSPCSAADRLRDSNDFFLRLPSLFTHVDALHNFVLYLKETLRLLLHGSANYCVLERVYLSPFGDKCFAQTKTRRRTLNPKFDEVFTFELSPVHFDERCLKIVAYRIDAFKRIVPVGHVLYPLNEYTLKKKKHLEVWRDFQKDETESQSLSSELHCSLVYNNSIERLTLTISQARDLDLCGNPESWGVYLKVELCLGTRRIKSRKSNTIRRTQSPVFNESFNFKLSPDKLDQASLIILVCQSKPDKVIARLILGGVMFTRNKPLQQWQDMMANMKTVVSEWHFLTE